MMEGNFRTSQLQDSCLAQPSVVSFENLTQNTDSVPTGFHESSFLTRAHQTTTQQDRPREASVDFTENALPIRMYDSIGEGSIQLAKQNLESNELVELCQASDVEDESVGKQVNKDNFNAGASEQDEKLNMPNLSSVNGDKKFHVEVKHETKSADVDPSDASDLLQEIQEENNKRLQGIFTSSIEVPPFTVDDETDILEMEKLSQEKNTLFSENLGLIAKNSKEFQTLTKLKSGRKRNRTRKTVLAPSSYDEVEIVPEAGHKHIKCTYKCGCCSRTFTEMCKLHSHLINHSNGGSYHYDHILKTAFPKYDSACAFTQTNMADDTHDRVVNKKLLIKPLRNVVKPKDKIGKNKRKGAKRAAKKNALPHLVSKRKRGRPKQGELNKTSEESKKEQVIAKIKVKTEDGGNTWHGIDTVNDEEEMITEENGNTVDTDLIYTDIDVDMDNTNRDENPPTSVNKYMPVKVDKSISFGIDKDSHPQSGENAAIEKCEKSTLRKRKMSIPRKLAPFGSTSGKIINSRARPEKKISCDFCPCKFQYTRGLIRHEQEKHMDEMKYECEVCKMKFMREYNKDRHVLCAHNIGKSKPKIGKKNLPTAKKKPGRKQTEKVIEEDKVCEECGKVLPESKAVIHARLHSGERPFICHVCGKGLISDKKLKRHLLIHSEVMRHTCEVCGQGFSMKYKLKTHMYIHTGHKPYLCSVCGAEFNNSTSLLHHHRTVHLGDKRFECNICGGKYGKKSQLEEHMFSHSSERTQTCRYCGKTFKHAKSLRRHESTHVSNEKFQCDQCDSKFSRKDNLERHKMCHFEVTLQCRFCKKKFRERKPLEEHEQFHINQKRLQCHVCKEKFLDETYFYNHMEKEHEMTRDMLPEVNILPQPKGDKGIEMGVAQDNNLIISGLKLAIGEHDTQVGNQSTVVASHPDTLNLSMNAAGIIPISSQTLSSQPNMQSILVTQNTTDQHGFNHSQNSISFNVNTSRILNQPINPSFLSTTHIIPGLHEGQRAIVNVINADDNTTIRLPLDQSTSENMILQEQQRLMQEALGSTLNMQGPSYRLQNLY